MNNKKIIILGVCIFTLLTIWAYSSLYDNSIINIDNANEKPVEVNSGVDTSDWVEYRNITLGYRVKFPSHFNSYSEYDGKKVELTTTAKAIWMHDDNEPIGVMISLASTANRTVDEAFNYQKERENTKQVLINGNLFITESSEMNYISSKTYIVRTSTNLLSIQFSTDTEKNYKYIRNGVLNSFEIVR